MKTKFKYSKKYCKVPLAVYINKYEVQIVSDSKVNIAKYPMQPYFYSFEEHTFEECVCNKVKKFSISKMKETEVNKYTFDNAVAFLKATRWNEALDNYPNGLSLKHLLFVEQPEFINKFDSKIELKRMVIDIEVLSEKGAAFPTADKVPIFAIGTWFNGEYKFFYSEIEDDTVLLKDFLKYFKECDPDIIAGYNHKKFDMPYIIDRCKIKKLDYLDSFRKIKDYWNKYDNFTGRVLLDLMWEVRDDLSVRGLPNYKLETVGRHFSYETVELEDDIKTNLKAYYKKSEWKKKILEYLYNDVELCVRLLEENYLIGKILLAENANVPLDDVIYLGSSFIPKIFCNRMMNQRNMISIVKNSDAPYFYGTYEGGKVKCYKDGEFLKQNVFHYDFANMHPSIMLTFNLSPDTVSFVSMKAITHDKFSTHIDLMGPEEYLDLFKFEVLEDSINFTFPDKNDDEVRIVTVNIKNEVGYLTDWMSKLYEERKKLKKEYTTKKDNNEDWQLEFSKQYMLKTQLNSTYGVQGSEFSYFTEYLIGPTVTAFSRYLITLIEKFVSQETVGEIDTDGLYSTNDVSEEELNKFVNETMDSNCSKLIKNSYLNVDKDTYTKGYFYKAKNYILVDKFGNLKIKGNSMKSSRNCKMIDNVFKEVIKRFMVNEESIYRISKDLFDFRDNELSDFALKVTVKDKGSYKSSTCLSRQLIEQVKVTTGETVGSGRQIYYFICTALPKYKIIELAKNKSELDVEYYNNEVKKVLERFGYEEFIALGQRQLSDYTK